MRHRLQFPRSRGQPRGADQAGVGADAVSGAGQGIGGAVFGRDAHHLQLAVEHVEVPLCGVALARRPVAEMIERG